MIVFDDVHTSFVNDVEKNDPDFVVGRHILIKKNGYNIAHVILDFLSFSISAHSKVLRSRTNRQPVMFTYTFQMETKEKKGEK